MAIGTEMLCCDVTVRTERDCFTYTALAASSVDAHADAIDRFGPCYVSIKVTK